MLSEKKCIEIEGAKKIVEFLENETDYGVCYATGSMRKTAKLKLEQIGIEYHDYQLVASNEILEREKIVSTAIEHAKIFYNTNDFENIISIGDGIWDLKTAKNLNLHFIGIGEKNSDILFENGAKVILSDFSFFDIELISRSLYPTFNI
jgi:phosphoglycolate phosphatase-like HAD superfamily hydrolase